MFLEGYIDVNPGTSLEILYPMIRHALSRAITSTHPCLCVWSIVYQDHVDYYEIRVLLLGQSIALIALLLELSTVLVD